VRSEEHYVGGFALESFAPHLAKFGKEEVRQEEKEGRRKSESKKSSGS
jgi:hypothetical protein